ncbi:lipid IV(A) 3-deoxy-D-manno-octulosonic acid transferase [Thalassotalea piscium]
MLQFFALLFYRVFFLCLLPLLLVLLFVRSKNNPDYRKRLMERFGFISPTFNKNSIVIHAASVGEVLALKPLVEKLQQQQPKLVITFTTFTPTGSAQVKKLFGDQVQHCYLPLDLWPCTALFLHSLQPQAIVFMETEIWPNLLAQCSQRDIQLLLVNARLSEKSVKSYQKLAWLIQPSLIAFNYIYCQSDDNCQRFLALGADINKTSVSGNLKYDIALDATNKIKQDELAQFINPSRDIWVVASTHPGDEEIILAAFKEIKKQYPALLLVLVPRHPERFDNVARLCQMSFNTIRRSSKVMVESTTDIWLLDSLGELLATFALANLVTMGGSFSEIGGHNPLEPALFKLPIIVGPDMHNFNDIMQQLEQHQGIIQLKNEHKVSEQLSLEIIRLLQHPTLASQYGEKAHQVVLANQGASQRSIDKLLELMNR